MKIMEVGFTPRRGDIVWADLEKQTGNVTYGMRPILIIGENAGNASSPNVQIVIGTDGTDGEQQNTQVLVPGGRYGLEKDTCFQAEQINTISKQLLRDYMGTLINTPYLEDIEKAIARTLGFSHHLNEPAPRVSILTPAPLVAAEQPPPVIAETAPNPPKTLTSKSPWIFRGLIRYTCPDCGDIFFFVNRDATSIDCRSCGKNHRLNNLIKFTAECGCCEHRSYGWTNAVIDEIDIRCKCGNPLTMKYSKKLNQYEG